MAFNQIEMVQDESTNNGNDNGNDNDVELFHSMILFTTVSVELRDCHSIDDYILHKLKKYEGKCLTNGYVKRDSIEIISRSLGKTNMYNNLSSIYYHVQFKASILNPQKEEIIPCIVKKQNKMGILAVGQNNIPLRIIIARQHHSDEIWAKYHDVNIGDKIKVKVIGSRFSINDRIISVIAKFQ